ncbi:MAG: methylenetetrahydrofolate reductase [NAD(P)H] [Dehalococcoidia bacterium]|nr:methylenetetrahydrofolate reductase [NAD(P)H] [Dehalococcoidia bacterium]
MRIHEAIARDGESLSFEFFPPGTPEAEGELFKTIDELKIWAPTYVSVTYGAGGSTLTNTMHIVSRVKEETAITPMPHLTCIAQTRQEVRQILDTYLSMGVMNVLALRGDPPKKTIIPPESERYCYAVDLVKLARSIDNAFSVSVAVYPEGHMEASSFEQDLEYTRQKIEAGAHFAITQMFFDNRYYYDFMDKAAAAGIKIPIIPGIMPVTDIARLARFSRMCGATLPGGLVHRIEDAASAEHARQIGLEFTITQCEDLLANGIRYFHFYTLNQSGPVTAVLRALRAFQEGLPAGQGLARLARESPNPTAS